MRTHIYRTKNIHRPARTEPPTALLSLLRRCKISFTSLYKHAGRFWEEGLLNCISVDSQIHNASPLVSTQKPSVTVYGLPC